MNSHALNVIEFPRTLALIAERATSPLGAERVRELRPRTDREEIEREHARVAAVRSLLSAEEPWQLHAVPDARSALTRLRVEGASLVAPDILILSALLRSARITREALRSNDNACRRSRADVVRHDASHVRGRANVRAHHGRTWSR